MAHSVGEQAARAVKNSQKQKVETRTPEQILKGIRGNLAAHLAVTPGDTAFLLAQYDSGVNAVETLAGAVKGLLSRAEAAEALYQEAVKIITSRNHEVAELQAKIEEFRSVYDMENRSMTMQIEQGNNAEVVVEASVSGAVPRNAATEIALHAIADLGGEA